MRRAQAATFWWPLVLLSGLRATEQGAFEEASFYYGTFPPGMCGPCRLLLWLCVRPSVCSCLWPAFPWLMCQPFWWSTSLL